MIIEFYHYVDVLPFLMATAIIMFGARSLNVRKPITIVVFVATATYMVAQSSWFSSWTSGNVWGRDIANYIWFMFNTLTIGIFGWVLLLNSEKQE